MESCINIRIIESTEDTGPRVCQVSRARQRGILREYLRWYLNDVSQVRPGKASAVQGFITVIPRHVSIRVGQFSRVLVDRLPVLRFERTAGKFTALDSNQTWSAVCYWHGVYTLQTGWVNYANELSQAALERSSQDAYDVNRLRRSKAAVWTVDDMALLIDISKKFSLINFLTLGSIWSRGTTISKSIAKFYKVLVLFFICLFIVWIFETFVHPVVQPATKCNRTLNETQNSKTPWWHRDNQRHNSTFLSPLFVTSPW